MNATVFESDFFQLFLNLPTRFFLLLFTLGLTFHPTLAEVSLYLIAAATIIAIAMQIVTRKPMSRGLFIGGDLFIAAFATSILIGLGNDGTQMADFAPLKFILMIYVLVHAYEIFPSLNERFTSLMIGSGVAVAIALFRAKTNLPLLNQWNDLSTSTSPFPHILPYTLTGFSGNPESFGFTLALLSSTPLALLFSSRRLMGVGRFFCGLLFGLCFVGALLTFQLSVWIVALIPLLAIFFVMKKNLPLVILSVVLAASYMFTEKVVPSGLLSALQSTQTLSSEERRTIFRANLKMFKSSPWIGVGYGQNIETLPQYFDEGKTAPAVAAPNTYFQLLASTGLVGFLGFMGFAVSLVFLSLRLWQDIPKTHQWHRGFVLSSMGMQMAFHSAGLFMWTLGTRPLLYLFVFAASIVSFLGSRYARGVVPDDYSL